MPEPEAGQDTAAGDLPRHERAFFGPGARFHHVGLAVRSIREIVPECDPPPERAQGVRLGFLDLHGLTVELLEPLDESSPIARNLQKGVKLLHLCFEVPSLEDALEHCRPLGFHRLGRPVPSEAFDGRRIVWVFSKELGLFELAERP